MKISRKDWMKIHAARRAAVRAAVIFGVSSILASAAARPPAPYEAGQYWEYALEGPRPGAMEPKAIGGRRILQVLDHVGADADARWVIEERFTNDPNVVSRLHIRDDRMLTTLVVENEKKESLKLAYESPVPHQYVDMDAGGSMQLKTSLVMPSGNFTLPVAIEITRLEDETIETPAGRFADCRHYRSVTESTFKITLAKISMKEHRQWWYSGQAGATVKEIYSKEPVRFGIWSKEGYTSTSTLAAFGTRVVSSEAQAAAIHDVNGIVTAPANRPSRGVWKVIVGVGACVAAGSVIFARRRKRARNQ